MSHWDSGVQGDRPCLLPRRPQKGPSSVEHCPLPEAWERGKLPSAIVNVPHALLLQDRRQVKDTERWAPATS